MKGSASDQPCDAFMRAAQDRPSQVAAVSLNRNHPFWT